MEKRIVSRVTGPYTKVGKKMKDGSISNEGFQATVYYSDGKITTKGFATLELCETWLALQKKKLLTAQAEATKDIPDYPSCDESNPLEWFVKILSLGSQRLLRMKP